MENKFTDMEKECLDLEIEDLENVTGGRKWGSDTNRPGPRMNSFAEACGIVLAEDKENESAAYRNVSEFAEAIKRRGGNA